MPMAPEYTFLADLDKATKKLCKLLTEEKMIPSRRIEIARDILMLAEDRGYAVEEIKKLWGVKQAPGLL